MSALQEILEKGYVDPELLEQLGEEQKQILFIKMREEQIRKWRLYEAEMEQREKDEGRKSGGKRRSQENDGKDGGVRRVQWLNGKDGDVWVWVMGEHPNDMSIEQILDKESEEKARRIAEKQIIQTLQKADNGTIQKLRLSDDLPNLLEREEAELKAELACMELNGTEKSSTTTDEPKVPNSHSPYDDVVENHRFDLHFESNGPSVQPTTSSAAGATNRPPTDGKIRQIASFPRLKQSPFLSNGREEQLEFYDNVNSFCPFESNGRSPNNLNYNVKNGQQTDDRPTPPPVPEKPAFLRRTVSNTMVMNSSNDANNSSKIIGSIRTYIPDSEVEKRQSQIFEQLREQRERLEREAEEEARREQTQWEEQQRRAREAEESIRRIAQKAREQHRKCLRTSDSLLPLFQRNGCQFAGTAQSMREALRALPRPPKPKSRQNIIQWFRSSELGQWGQKRPPLWFHGIISRLDSERLLVGKSSGAFLIRVTERIFGYTVSYRTEDGPIKNFLIERISEGYQFMGTNQLVHASLVDLVAHHQKVPITAKGGELLREAVGQRTTDGQQADYAELFKGTHNDGQKPQIGNDNF
ncbi:hypothetical protein niasHT_011891 [Heterodera trifolii]|uniref:SH2 domain-containing protein n=1 Tax=Heterodera trifolii TaxID=157864 RepID=A0ABD2KWW3_9BILA